MANPKKRRKASLDSEVTRPELVRSIVLNTPEAQKVFDRNGIKLMSSFVSADIVLRFIGREDQIKALAELIDRTLNSIEEEYAKKSKPLDALILQYKLANSKVNFPTKRFDVSIRTPWANQYIDLVLKVDEIYQKHYQLWLQNKMSSDDKFAEDKSLTRSLNKFTSVVISTVRKAYAAAQKTEDPEIRAKADEAVKDIDSLQDDEDVSEDKPKKKPARKRTVKSKNVDANGDGDVKSASEVTAEANEDKTAAE